MPDQTHQSSTQTFSSAAEKKRPHRWTRILSTARWVSVVVCVTILAYRYAQLEFSDYVVDVDGDGEQATVSLPPVPPADSFTFPTARELAQISEGLVESPRERRQAARQLNAITNRPELINDDPKVYLTLRTAYWQLRRDPRIVGSYDAAMILVDAAERLEYTHKIESARAVGQAE